MRVSKGWTSIFLLLLATIRVVTAQESEMEVSGFRVPEYDEQGVMTSQLFGERAVMEGGGPVEITAARLEFYREGETFMTVESPSCFFDQKTNEAWSDSTVSAELEGIRIRGRGFKLQSSTHQVQVLEDSRVIIEDIMQQAEEAPLLEGLDRSNDVTVITSQELFLDYNGRAVRFEKSVHVQDPRMTLDCATLKVRFSENNEIDWIEALDGVRLLGEGREAYAERATYEMKTDEFLLENHPKIITGRHILLGDRIRFWRATGRMICEPSARLIVYPDDGGVTELLEN